MIFALPDLLPVSVFVVGVSAALSSYRDSRARMRELDRRRAERLARIDQQLDEYGPAAAWRSGQLPNSRIEATARAWVLLCSYLSPQQRDQLSRTKRFDLVAPSGRHYRIRCTGGSHNVTWFDPHTGRVRASYCAVPRQLSIPAPDHYLTQAMMLMIDEKHFLDTAFVRYPATGHLFPPAHISSSIY